MVLTDFLLLFQEHTFERNTDSVELQQIDKITTFYWIDEFSWARLELGDNATQWKIAAPGMFLLFSLIFLSKFEYEHYQMFGMKIGEKCLLYVRFTIVCTEFCSSFPLHSQWLWFKVQRWSNFYCYTCDFVIPKNNIQCTSAPCLATLTMHLCRGLKIQIANAEHARLFAHNSYLSLKKTSFKKTNDR